MTSISNMDDVQIQHLTNSNNITKKSNKEIIQNESNNIDRNHAAYSNHEYENMQQVKESNLHEQSFHWYKWIMIIWIIGMFSLFFWFLTVNCIFYLRLRRYRVKATIKCTLPVYIIKDLGSPCIFGIRKPAIYLNEAAVKKKIISIILLHMSCAIIGMGIYYGLFCVVFWYQFTGFILWYGLLHISQSRTVNAHVMKAL